jgi:TolB-like protein/class 3 adenylate cyclase/Tfp pilus assembly protein PilF
MSTEVKKEIHLEIAHVLFMDVVGFSKLLINDQSEILEQLNQLVRETPHFREAEAAGKLIRLSTGDGMALVFSNSAEAPVECALEISKGLKSYPQIQLRMGVHSGPVNAVSDVNDRSNVTGSGINMAQRVMDCGDAGHILLSRHVAEDLEQYRQWQPCLHDLGECEVKHGGRVHVVNLYTEEVGNREAPQKFRQLGRQAKTPGFGPEGKLGVPWALIATVITIGALAVGVLFWLRRGAPALTGVAASPTPAAANVSAVPEKSIAVLPFENLSRDPDNAFFTDGVQDEILTDLARVADLKVISRTSVMQYKSGIMRNLREIGQQLGVAHVVEGNVQRSGNRVRVNAQLIDARSDHHLWGQTYDRDLADVFAIQSEIAKTIADQLQAKLSPDEKNAIERPPTSDVTAFDLYTRAKNLLVGTSTSSTGKADLLQGIELLNRAVERDPAFFQAYCQLAGVHDALYFFGFDHTSARLALAEAAIQTAFRLRPDAGETHLARAQNLYHGYLDYDGALAELEVARQTLPNDPRVVEFKGYIQRRQGRWEESLQNLERAIELDPRNVRTLQQTAQSYQVFRHYAEEKSVLARILAFEPNDAVAKVQDALVESDSKADIRPLHQMIESIRATNPAVMPSIADNWLICALVERDAAAAKNALIAFGENPITFGSAENVVFNRPFVEGVIARMTKEDGKAQSAFTGARTEQEKILRAQPNYGPALCVLGLIDAGLGRKEEALREGRRAVELLPVEKDELGGTEMVKYLAMIAAWVGDKDLACEQLAIAVRRPSDLSYGQLKLLPFWDPLRGDPRFEKIVEEVKKPVVLR